MNLEFLSINANEFSFGLSIIILISYIVIDGIYAFYTLSVADKKPFTAATSGAVIHFLMAVGILSYVQNFLYIIPIIIGSWIGTYLVVRYSNNSA